MKTLILAASLFIASTACASDAFASDGLVWTGETYPVVTNYESQPSPGYNWHNTYTTVQVSNSTGHDIRVSSFVWDYVAHTVTYYNGPKTLTDGASVSWWSGGGSNPNAKAVYVWCNAPYYPQVGADSGQGYCSTHV